MAIPTEVIYSVFHLRVGNVAGTGFTLAADGKEYLITARHVVEKLKNSDCIDVRISGHEGWESLSTAIVGHADGEIDISVLALSRQITRKKLHVLANPGITYGQDAYFLGFPPLITGETILDSTSAINHPLPLVKRCIVSSLGAYNTPILLDGHNIPGFSGGPVVFRPLDSIARQEYKYQIAAVVSGYQMKSESILDEKYQKTSLRYLYNTGIVQAYRINHALDLIQSNPIGVPISI